MVGAVLLPWHIALPAVEHLEKIEWWEYMSFSPSYSFGNRSTKTCTPCSNHPQFTRSKASSGWRVIRIMMLWRSRPADSTPSCETGIGLTVPAARSSAAVCRLSASVPGSRTALSAVDDIAGSHACHGPAEEAVTEDTIEAALDAAARRRIVPWQRSRHRNDPVHDHHRLL